MGQSAAETVKEIEQVRDNLETKLRTLETRLPSPVVWTKRAAGLAVGGGAGGAVFWFAMKRLRRRARSERAKKQAPKQAAFVELLPPRWVDELPEMLRQGRAAQYAAMAGGVWVLLRFAELRQLRRMNRALLAGRP